MRSVISFMDLRVEVFESQKFKPRLFLSRTGFGGGQSGVVLQVPGEMGFMQERLGRKLENMSLVVETPFTQLIDPFPAHFHFCHGFVLFCFCHECLGTWPIQMLFLLQTLLLGIHQFS